MWFQELKPNLIFSHSGWYLLLLKTLLLGKLTWEVWEQTPPVKQGKEVFFGYFSIFHVLCHLLSYSIQQQAHVNLFLISVFDVRFGCPSSQLPGSSWAELWICWCHAWKPRGILRYSSLEMYFFFYLLHFFSICVRGSLFSQFGVLLLFLSPESQFTHHTRGKWVNGWLRSIFMIKVLF